MPYLDSGYFDAGYFDPGYFGTTSVAETNPDLPAAILAYLRATPAIVSAFGEDESSPTTTKLHPDVTPDHVALPYLTYQEIGSDYMYTTGTASIETGQIRFVIASKEKKEARDLGRLLMDTLNEAPLVFDDGLLMNIRAKSPFFVPIGNVLPGSSIGYSLVVVFDFMCQRGS